MTKPSGKTGSESSRETDVLRERIATLEAELEILRRDKTPPAPTPGGQQYSELIDLAPDAMMIHDLDRVIRYINPAGVKMFGASKASEIIGTHAIDYVHPEARAKVREMIRENESARLTHASVYTDQRRVRLDGTEYYGDVSVAPVHWEGRDAFLVTVRDVTERIRERQKYEAAEAERREAHLRLLVAIESMNEGFALWDADDKLQLYNRNYVDLIWRGNENAIRPNLTFDEMALVAVDGGIWDGSERSREEILSGILSRHHNLPSHDEIDYPNGPRILQSKKRTSEGGVVSVSSDISGIKQREAALQASEKRYRDLLEALPDLIIIHVDDRIVFANSVAAQVHGFASSDDLLGGQLLSLSDEVSDILRERRRIALEEKRDMPPFEHQIKRRDGSVAWLETVGKYTEWEGKPAYLAVGRDITARKETEAALQQTERRLTAVTENMPGAVFQRVMEPDGSIHLSYVSAGIEEVTGISADQLMSDMSPLLNALKDDYREKYVAAVQQSARDMTPLDIEVLFTHADGSERWLQSTGRPRKRRDGGVEWDGIFMDITDRKRAEIEAGLNHHWLLEAIRTVSGTFLLWDPDDRLVLWNDGVNYLHTTPDVFKEGLKFEDMVTPVRDLLVIRDGKEAADKWFEERCKVFREAEGSIEFEAPTGRRLLTSERRTAEGFTVTLTTDVTERYRNEQALRMSEKRYRDLLENLPDVVLIYVDDKVVFANSAAAEILGVESRDDLIGVDTIDLGHSPDAALIKERRVRALREKKTQPPVEQRRLRPDGTMIWLESIGTPVVWEGKDAYMGVGRDITARKEAEAALAESEHRYSVIVENIPGAVFQRKVTPDGEVSLTYVSPRIEQVMGISAESMMSDTSKMVALLREDFRESYYQRVLDATKAMTPYDMEVAFNHPSGEERWLHSRAFPRKLPDGSVLWDGITVDVTPRKKAQIEAERNHGWLMGALDSMSSGFLLWDREDRLVLWNDGAPTAHPKPELFTEGVTFEELIAPTYALIAEDQGKEIADEWVKNRRELHANADGSMEFRGNEGRWYNISERRTGDGFVVSLMSDVSERRLNEERLRESEERYRALINLSPDAIYLHREGRITYCNEAALRLYGAETVADLIGKHSLDLTHPDYREIVTERINIVVEDGTETVRMRQRRLRLDGSDFWAEVAAAAVDLEGSRGGIVALRDITDQIKIEEDMKQAREDAELASRAKTEFLANMSHELRTPLNAIIGFSDLMRQETFGPLGASQYGDYIQDIYQSGTHLLHVINDILDLSKVEAGKLDLDETEINLSDLVDRCVRLVMPRADENGLELFNNSEKNLPPVIADDRKLKQVLINLLSNAVKFTEAGGTITVDASYSSQTGPVIRITDTGVGMEAEAIPRALEVFGQVDSTLSRKFEGTGLGLPLTRSLVELHGGTFAIESRPGVGTTVTVSLPEERVVHRPSAAE